jgi:predicted nucleic acid-binding protein
MTVTMSYLPDTTVLIDHATGRYGASGLLLRLFEETGDVYTCDAVVAEALTGGDDAERVSIEKLIQALEYVSTSPDAARWAAAARRDRRRTAPRRLADALIAGVAWSLDATIVTRNPRDFEGLGVPVLTYGQTAA